MVIIKRITKSERIPLLTLVKECPNCEGSGKNPDAMYGCWVNCPQCGGRGRVEVKGVVDA